MQKWEYRTISQKRDDESFLKQSFHWTPVIDLNQLGSEGWELVNAFSASSIVGDAWAGLTNEVVWVFKRPIE